jgi:hypothetical protein
VRDDLAALVKDVGLTTIGLGVAFGYALFSFGSGVATFVDGLLTRTSSSSSDSSYTIDTGPGLSWQVGHRLVTLDAMLIGAIELLVVLAAAYFLRQPGRLRRL